VQADPALPLPSPDGWRANLRRPRWWLHQPWFVVACIAVAGFAFTVAVRHHGMHAGSSLTNNPETVPFPVTSGDQGCQNFAQYWTTDSGLGVSPKTIAAISTCRQAADGSWFLPTGPNDPRLPAGEAMTSQEKMATAALRADILAEIAVLDVTMPGSLRQSLNSIRTGDRRAVIQGIRRGANIGSVRAQYTRMVQAFLISPDNQALAQYVGWIMQQRSDALNVLLADCKSDPSNAYLFTACDTVGNALSIGYPPFIWDLFNPLTLDNYLAHVVRGGSPTPTATPVLPA
jgi:hypothetical protein